MASYIYTDLWHIVMVTS